MIRKQKFLAVFLTGCICLTAGCGKQAEGTQEAVNVQESEAAGDSGMQDEPEDQEVSGQDQKEASAAPQVVISRENLEEYEEDTNRWLVHTEYDSLSVTGEGYEAAAEGVRQWSEARTAEIRELSSEYAGYAAEDAAYQDAENTAYQYSIYESLETARVDSRVISIIEMNSDYTGGAHGNYGYYGYTFDAENGQLLELMDILEDAGGFQEAASDYIIQKLKETQGDGLFPEYADEVRDTWTRNEGPNWYLDAAGITFIFNPYEVGPFAMGEVRVTLPYEEFASYIKDAYGKITGPGSARIPEDAEVRLSLNGTDEQEAGLRLCQNAAEGYYEGPVYVELNGSAVETGAYGRIVGAYLLKKEDGRTFVLLNTDESSDDFLLFVYEITDGTIQERDCMEKISLRNGTVNTESLTLWVNLDVLGTYTSMMDYTIGEDGRLSQQEEFFQIESEGSAWDNLTNVRELPVMVDGEETVLPVGSQIRITATDNAGTAVFYNESIKESGEIHYIRGDGGEDTWTIYIDGIPDYEYFEMVPYAG